MFGTNLKILRLKNKLTQAELAAQVGVSSSTIGMYESGRREPDHATLLKIAQILGASTDDLLTDHTGGEKKELLSEIRHFLINSDSLMFNGQPLTDEELSQVIEAMELSAEIAMRRSKENSRKGRG